MKNNQKSYFIGIDLGGKNKKTTGICILGEGNGKLAFNENCSECKNIFGRNILKVINPYLESTEVIAIDGPLTEGKGKGEMRLYEKFLSTKIFRKEKVNPLPPALMPELCRFALELVEKLEEKGFVLDMNLIEVFPTLVKKIVKKSTLLKSDCCKSEDQKAALVCARLAFWHLNFKTRYLGYKDGFLFLPEMSLWKKGWRKKFYDAWRRKDKFKYKHLITNIFKYK